MGTVSVRVDRKPGSGGISGLAPSIAMWSGDCFHAAIGEAAVQSQLFTQVVADGPVDYELTVTILNFTQPAAGFDMTVTMAADWSLRQSAGGRELVPSSCRKSLRDAFNGRTRLLLATECTARENIAEGLQRIARLLDRSPPPTTKGPAPTQPLNNPP